MSTWENEKKCGGNLQQLNFTQVDAGVVFAEEGRGKQKKSVGERQKVRKRNPELHFLGAPSPPLPQTMLRRMDEDSFGKENRSSYGCTSALFGVAGGRPGECEVKLLRRVC